MEQKPEPRGVGVVPRADDPTPRVRATGFRRVLAALRGAKRRGANVQPSNLRRHELSVVAFDLRGFTEFLELAPPERVVGLLRQYYEVVAQVAQLFGGRVKDHAGDGTLVLVGAARPSQDHATRAVAMAFAVHERLLDRWRAVGSGVGLGAGVASGEVTVGTIAAGSHIEPVAIGLAVNLAARLCARARSGQILVAERTVELARRERSSDFHPLEKVRFKGFSRDIRVYEAAP